MAVTYSVQATFKDHKGGVATVKVVNPPGFANFQTMDDAAAFGRGIAKYSRAGLVSVSVSGTTFIGEYPDSFGVLTTQTGEHYDLVEQKLVIYFRDKKTNRIVSIQIPAPADSCFVDQQPNTDAMEDIADIIGAASNYASGDLMPVKGGLTSRLMKKQDFIIKTGV